MSDEPYGDRMERVLRKRLRRVVERGPAALSGADPQTIGTLRAAIERLRSDVEFVVPIAAQRSVEPIRLLGRLHERLTAIVDAAAFGRIYAELRENLSPDDPRRVGLESLVAGAARDGERALDEARKIWNGEASGEPYPGRLAVSISAALGSLSPNGEP